MAHSGRFASLGRELLVMGDFNGQMQELEGFYDYNGKLRLQLAQDLSFDMLNLPPD